MAANGVARVEVTVPATDASLVRDLAALLRAGGEGALRLRESVRPLIRPRVAVTGEELIAFFRASPLVGEPLVFERDRSEGRQVSF
jgi:hypothetical protein